MPRSPHNAPAKMEAYGSSTRLRTWVDAESRVEAAFSRQPAGRSFARVASFIERLQMPVERQAGGDGRCFTVGLNFPTRAGVAEENEARTEGVARDFTEYGAVDGDDA